MTSISSQKGSSVLFHYKLVKQQQGVCRLFEMASNPPGSCCNKGVKHEGQPVGSISRVKDFEVYTSYPADKSTDYAVLM